MPVFGLFMWLVLVSTGRTHQELATGALSGMLYVLGGYDQVGNSTATVEVYNPVTDTWTFAHALPYTVNHNAAAVAGGKLHSFGAGAGETYVYDPNGNSWSAKASSLLRQL